MAEAVVVGAGQSGLTAARLLAERGVGVTLVERLPAPGGQDPQGRLERELARDATRSGVEMTLGTLAVRWTCEAVQTLGVDGAANLPATVLVVATGTRPATRGELGIAGDRCAGVLPGSAAVHLIESGVLVGRRPVIFGSGELAGHCAELLAREADQVTVVSPLVPAPGLFPAEVAVHVGWRVVSTRGRLRLSEVSIERDGLVETLSADALILASGRVPMWNIEGAVDPDRSQGRVVSCHSSADPKDPADAERVARRAVSDALEAIRTA